MSDVILELRAARPSASDALRERVHELGSRELAAPARRLVLPRLPARRVALVLVPACVVLAVVGALAHGLATSGGGGGTEVNALRRSGDAAHQPAVRGKDREFSPAVSPLTAQKRAGATSLPPSGERLQNYSASMRLRLN